MNVFEKIGHPTPSGCREWLGYRTANGYGHVKINGRKGYAHRMVYEILVGPIPPGLTLDHLCRNRACVNTDHLEPVALRVNVLRGFGTGAINARKTACPEGHPLAGDNLKTRASGSRACLRCERQKGAEYMRARRALARAS